MPAWHSVLAVVAHPDDESFGLGAVLSAFAAHGATVSVLCLTHGEASTLHGVPGDLTAVRAAELHAAAQALGVDTVELLDHPDGRLATVPPPVLAAQVAATAAQVAADGLVVFDPGGVTGHPDHRAATAAALSAAARAVLPVLGWTLPARVAQILNAEYGAAFTGHQSDQIDLTVPVDRTRQFDAVHRHPSQAVPGSVLWRRLELLANIEYLRWLPERRQHEGGSR
ncbi:PIG-L family deacetylase [Krasilnikovia sp. M28-CT-15]|uniref:PIG-L family deacetylase n=1 Tax=Krasilnikovia sp. M28-CT-15 TaxID=3373540 RepID=UPI00399CE786